MKKQWNNPTIKSAGVRITKNVKCPYIDVEDGIMPYVVFGPDRCCPCEFKELCNKSWKYRGSCTS